MSRLLAFIFACILLFPLTGRARRETRVEFVTTAGNFTVRLLPDTPIHSRHFEQLVRAGYYDGLLFHRVIRDFMVQAGDSRVWKPKNKVNSQRTMPKASTTTANSPTPPVLSPKPRKT